MQYLDFPVEEMKTKLNNARKYIDEEGLSGLFITATENYFYFTGYRKLADWATFTRPVFLFIPKEKEPVLYLQDFGFPEARSRSFVQDIRSFSELMTTPVDGVVEIMRELDMADGKIGCELGYEQRLDMPYLAFQELQDKLPEANFTDASSLLWKLRMIKQPFEIECMRKANIIASYAFDECFNVIHEGMTEKEIARKLVVAMAEGGADLPGFIIVISGEGNYERISARPTEKIVRKGDLIWIDAGVQYNGYWTDWCRAGVVGGPTSEQARLQEIIHKVTWEGCKAIAPGVQVAEIAKVCAREMTKYGLPWSFECGRAGHGVGLKLTEPPTLAPSDNTILQSGMVVTVEPGYVSNIGCFDVEENILVTDSGYEILSGASRELYTVSTDG